MLIPERCKHRRTYTIHSPFDTIWRIMQKKARSIPVATTWSIFTAIVLLLAAPSTALASAGGSDSPTPYTVDTEGITLPEGSVFLDNGHINVRTSDDRTVNVHFESKCIDRNDAECSGDRHKFAQYIGKSFIPWSVLGIYLRSECVAWVQLSAFNEHFGEGGQAPIGYPCSTDPEEPTTPVEPEEPVTPTGLPATGGSIGWALPLSAGLLTGTGGLLIGAVRWRRKGAEITE